MRKEFIITGLFYQKNGYKFRMFLNIKKKFSNKQSPDLIVIMMNPGSSKPVDGIENNIKESFAVPDKTQDQIMRVMQNSNFDYARILNLSDLREPKSEIFFQKLKELDQNDIPHSIFDKKREKDFNSIFTKNVPVVFAWGVDRNLKIIAQRAINIININNPLGIRKQNSNFAFYHPLPPNSNKQKEWVEKIIKIINSKIFS